MILYSEPTLSVPEPCPYLPGREMRLQLMVADRVSAVELEGLLSTGWRKFGKQYFRPVCASCRACVPIRVCVDRLCATKSQRRIVRRAAAGVAVAFGDLCFRNEIFEVYADHAMHKFNKRADIDELLGSGYDPSCPALQAEYLVEGKLAAIGFLDCSSRGFSSVYFVYKKEYSRLGLGTYSVFAESEHARTLGLPYYYLGYRVSGCRSMEYKGRFSPAEYFDWEQGVWDEVHTEGAAGI